MHPTALMQPLMDVVAPIEVAAQYPWKIVADQLLDDFPGPGVMIFIIADLRGTHAPDVAILAIFSPGRFIGLDGRTGSNLPFESVKMRLDSSHQTVKQFADLSRTDRYPIQRGQQSADLSHWQPHHRAQGGNQAHQADAEPSLPQHLCL